MMSVLVVTGKLIVVNQKEFLDQFLPDFKQGVLLLGSGVSTVA